MISSFSVRAGLFASFFAGLFVCLNVAVAATPSDVFLTTRYADSIQYVIEKGVMKGYSDGAFRPKRVLNRAELLKVLVESKLGKAPAAPSVACFKDVKPDAWYAPSVCYAKTQEWVTGYSDGRFRPGNEISLAEAGKLMVGIFEIPLMNPAGSTIGAPQQPWYAPSLSALAERHVIPDSFGYVGQVVQRDQMAEMLHRLRETITGRVSVQYANLKSGACQIMGEDLPTNIDMGKIRSTWLGWYNSARVANGLLAYGYNLQLDRTATAWSETAKSRGAISHKRDGQTAYYDYNMIRLWFEKLGLIFENVNRITFTENIGWSPYSCSKADCTDDVIKAIRYTFDFYMAEKGKANAAHYNSLMNAYFKDIGLGLAIDEPPKKLYLTIHYAINITSNPAPICVY